ncbi:hypothetical protein MC885_013975 [Smutsia gigantea]|nr:hypothetical protein MC885_013975 [Smutsia gigantea]
MCVRPAPGRPGFASASALASTRASEEPPHRPARGAGEEIINLILNEKIILKVAYSPRKNPKCFYILPEYKI